MNTRSIHFRLISWYTILMIIACIGFGSYTYSGLKNHLYDSLYFSMNRRSSVIGRGILAFSPDRGAKYIKNEIETIFSPEENNRFVRITNEKKKIVYVSGMPRNERFNPINIPELKENFDAPVRRELDIHKNIKLIILSSHFRTPKGQNFIIEVGDTTEGIKDTLDALFIRLCFGLPFVLLLTAAGGYILVQNSLKPVENIRQAAEKISLTNLKKRIPVIHSGDSIEHLSHTLNSMISRLEAAYQQASQFSTDASHELRTPLTVMRGELESILIDSPQADIKDRLLVVLEETERLTTIAEGLFAISRLDAGEARMQIVIIDLANLAKNTLEQMRLLADEKNLVVTCETDSKVEIEGDPSRLKQVIVNLLDNAIKYTPDGGLIELKVYVENYKAILEVADSGIGIPDEDKSNIFERFYRADKARTRDLGGAGLGLSIVRSICIAHHAEIKVESIEGKGSRFIIEFSAALDPIISQADDTSPQTTPWF